MKNYEFKDRDLYSSAFLEGKLVGRILKESGRGWFYSPKDGGAESNPRFKTRAECKAWMCAS